MQLRTFLTRPTTPPQSTPDYALRVPQPFRYLLAFGLLGGLAGLVLAFTVSTIPSPLIYLLLTVGLVAALLALGLVAVTSGRARSQARGRMLSAVQWRGDERVLDMGCGNGFLLVEAAKHLTTGTATGIDIWLTVAGQQTADALWRNARLEGVADRIELQDADARGLPFADNTFDVIVSSLMLHHAGSAADRQQVLREMARVVKPEGTILLYDMLPFIVGAARDLRANGLTRVTRSGRFMTTLSARQAKLNTGV
jgi:arsenite methyltransferase